MASIILSAPLKGWASGLETVPDAVFSGRLLGDGVAIDPVSGVLHAPCDGEVLTVHAAGHAVTLCGEGGVELLMHIGVDTVALGGRGFESLVAPGDRVGRGQPLVRFDLDAVAGAAPSLLTPVIVTNGNRFRLVRRTVDRLVTPGDNLLWLEPLAADAPAAAAAGPAVRTTLRVPLAHGIHARPAARIGEVARGFQADTRIVKDGLAASTRSPIGLLRLAVKLDDEIVIEASGDDADAAVAALEALIAGGMGEARHADAQAPRDAATPPASPRAAEVPEGTWGGTLASPGFCIGTVRRLRMAEPELPAEGDGPDAENARLDAALAKLSARLEADALEGPGAAILRAHRALLDDPELIGLARSGIAAGQGAALAWREACRCNAAILRQSGDARFAERADDLLDLGRQLVSVITGAAEEIEPFPPGTVLIAEELLPSQVTQLDGNVVGIVLEQGGPTSHVAILAASMGIPMLVALGPDLAAVADGVTAVVDADRGFIRLAPSDAQIGEAEAELAARAAARARMLAAAAEPCRSRDGVRIEVFVNLGSLGDAVEAMTFGAEGCGLLRTEFLFLDRMAAPSVEEQAELYGAIAETLEGRPLIVRLMDIGGDKPAPYLPMPVEPNPALGLRGIRVGLSRPDLLDQQLRAILSARGRGQLKIMVPMVTGLSELREVRRRVEALRAELDIAEPVELGIMVETPAAAVTAPMLAQHADFFSVGTNDLTQYVLAMDRDNPAVAGGIDGLHPAVLAMIAQAARGAQAAGRWIGVCGGLAADRLAVPVLLGLGVTELSAPARQLPDIKALVRRLSIGACKSLAMQAIVQESAGDVRALSRRFVEGLPS
ncbi:Phosphocarrier protein HPr /phosphoenolpyruvate--protein phosphotransferase /PTS system IIA component, Glc family [Novosphingobium sp. CF614]|uniref:phosphoenolpyruvate--protein phosphotransferase n=1 Tax=Novosphingobium sp. CF614 TaxID=1884364 RepID=UPI0008DF040C|nr:phosphoenolpyruvate--protein phosphotransferase [Novosphingobium sp. CF614]SFF72809.1 Phosphocarrier protein HPr /phosphoenolpyruvate--protein phosphotransferase /PTS system IIA component, Glc family [Novosphingobium sp. CF614]